MPFNCIQREFPSIGEICLLIFANITFQSLGKFVSARCQDDDATEELVQLWLYPDREVVFLTPQIKFRQWNAKVKCGLVWWQGRQRQLDYVKGIILDFSQSVQFSRSVVSDSLWPHGLQHARLACPSPSPRTCANHQVGDAIQPSHLLSSPSPPALNLPQYQGLFQWVSSSHQVARVLEFQLQHQSFPRLFRTDFL